MDADEVVVNVAQNACARWRRPGICVALSARRQLSAAHFGFGTVAALASAASSAVTAMALRRILG